MMQHGTVKTKVHSGIGLKSAGLFSLSLSLGLLQ
jgi:hypothetical protein